MSAFVATRGGLPDAFSRSLIPCFTVSGSVWVVGLRSFSMSLVELAARFGFLARPREWMMVSICGLSTKEFAAISVILEGSFANMHYHYILFPLSTHQLPEERASLTTLFE